MRHTIKMAAFLLAGVAAVCPLAAAGESGVSILSVQAIVTGASAFDSFRRPESIVADTARGVVLVADTGNRRLVSFDRRWRSRGSIPFSGRGASEPRGLALDRKGRIFVADALQGEFTVLSSRGSRIASFMPRIPASGARVVPQDVAIGASGRMYFLLAGSHPGICVTDEVGAPIRQIGFDSTGTGLFHAPSAMAVSWDESRIAIVDDLAENSILLLDADGGPVASFGKHGEGKGTFSLANDVIWGPGNSLWITDTLRHSISVFDDRGNPVGRIGGFGEGPGQFTYPVGCAFLAPGRIVVLERASARCQVLEVEVTLPSQADEHLGLPGPESFGAALTR